MSTYIKISNEERQKIKSYLSDYLRQYHNIDTTKLFRCLNPEHEDNHPSMKMSGDPYNICHCFACGKNYNIFDLVALDNNLELNTKSIPSKDDLEL